MSWRTSLWLGAFLALMAAGTAATPAEVDAFWAATRERLAREPMEAVVEPLAQPLPYATFAVTLRSLDGVRVKAYLALPIRGEGPAHPWPVLISTPGYGGTQQGVMLSECQRGYAVLQLFPRGQGDSAALWPLEHDRLTWRLDQPEGAYYQGAYADVIRAIDFVCTRKEIDPARIALVGTSQGGGFSLAVGALDARVKTVVAHVPFLCDFRQAAGIPGSLVKNLLDRAGRNDERAWSTLDFFDPVVLAPRTRASVLLSSGGRDAVCPAATIAAVHARLPGEKVLKVYPELPHTTCLDFYRETWVWLDAHLSSSPP